MKKKLSLMCLTLLTLLGGVVFAQSLRRANATITWNFSEFETNEAVTTSPYDYNGMILVMTYNATKDYSGKAGFHANGSSSTSNRYITYTPEYSGTLRVTYKSNNSSATDRITAIGTAVVNFTAADEVPSSVLAYGFTEGSTAKTIEAELEAGKTYYIFFASGGQTITMLQYTYDPSSGGGDYTYQNYNWNFSVFPETPADYQASPMNVDGYDYDGLICHMPYAEKDGSATDYITKNARFHGNGASNSSIRYMTYTPEYDGTLTVRYRSNNGTATDRITAVGSAVKTFNKANADAGEVPAEVVAYGFTAGSTEQSFDAELVKGQKYYIYFANGGQTITEVSYVARIPKDGGDEPSSNAIVYDFAAAAAAGENPDNFNYGSAFYAWESDEKADSRRQDYRGYTNYAGSNLPAECHFFRRTDRINGNIGDGGLKCPNNRECVIDGIEAGKKVIITYNADNATTKTILWTSATGEGHTTKATLGKSSRVCISGKSEIASNAVIHIRETECGYFSFRVMKGMVIEKIVIDDDDSGDEVLPAYQTTFDFNSLTSFDLNAEVTTKIADLEIFDEVTETKMTVSDSGDAEAPNRFVESEESGLIQLEVNGGTLVFDAPTEDHSIKKISFFYHTWDEGNTAETGEVKAAAQRRADEESDEPVDPAALTGFTVDAEKQTATWAGSAQKVIVTIAGKTIINKITVEVGERKGEKLVMDVPSGSDLGKVVEDIFKGNPYVGSITLNLAKDGKYTSSKPMYTSKPLIINGAEGAVIDASGNEESFIQMMTLPELGLNEAGAYPIDEITIKDVQIKGLKNRLFYAARQKYLISKMTVENSILGFDAKVPRTIFDFYCGGNTAELIIKNSTLWANPANTHRGGLFSSQASQDVPSLGGPESQKFIFENNTFYNIAYGVTPMLHRDHSRYWLSFELKENVIVNCGEPGKFVLGMNEGQPGEECIWYVEGNSFTFDGQSTNNDEAYVMRPVMGGIEFANADKGDFALSVLDEAFDAGIGDPRWLTGTEGELFVDLPTGKDIAAEVAAAKGDKKVTNILVRLAKDGQYTMSGTIEASASVGIIGDEAGIATIDASASEAPFLTLAGTETPAKNADGTENASYKYINLISISNLKINGLKQALVRDTQKTYVGRLLVNNDVINVEGSANIFDFNGQGYPATLLVNNSTLWSKDGHTGYLLQSSGRVRDLDSDQKSYTQNIVVGFSTLYKISVGKQLNNLQGKGQKSLVLWLTYSIVAESTQAGNEVRGWLGGQNSTNPVVLYYANSYWADGAVQAGWTDSSKQGYDDSESSIEGDPQFKNPAEGDFTLGASTKQTQLKVGDPRWLVEYDPTTAIEAVERAKETVSDGAWYTLQGVRVDKPAKGVYIHNGKKVVVK